MRPASAICFWSRPTRSIIAIQHEFGFDAAMEFAPNNMGAPKILPPGTLANPDFSGVVYDYRYLVERARHYEATGNYLLFRSVTPMWDNEPRRPGQGAIFAGSSPDLYSDWLRSACRDALAHAADKPFVFINAWNEWAEGAHLEPDRAHGYAYLQATADALGDFPTARTRPSIVLVSHDAHFYGAQRLALILAQTLAGPLNFEVEILLGADGPLREDFGRAGRVHELYDDRYTWERQDRLMRDLHDRGARIALCNTSCVGEVVRRLKSAGFRVVSMIHELPGLIGEYSWKHRSRRSPTAADRVVFPAGVVRDRFVELTSLPADKAVVRPQGLLASNRYGGRDESARRDLRQLLGIDAATRIVLGVGSAHLRKGVDLFVDSGLVALGSRDDLAFVWVGHKDGDGYGLAAQHVEQAGAWSRFFFPGVIAGHRSVLLGIGRLPAAVPRRSVSQRGAARVRRRAPRSGVRRCGRVRRTVAARLRRAGAVPGHVGDGRGGAAAPGRPRRGRAG